MLGDDQKTLNDGDACDCEYHYHSQCIIECLIVILRFIIWMMSVTVVTFELWISEYVWAGSIGAVSPTSLVQSVYYTRCFSTCSFTFR